MFIQPTTTVKLLKNCPLDKSYEHTIFFTSLSDQLHYFNGLVKQGCIFSELTYQRIEKGKIRVQKNAEGLYDCNYLMFQNNRFENGRKWFFAFIKSIEYVNEIVSDVTFEIDIMQTWAFDSDGNACYSLGDCFVERNHSITDTIGSNIVSEGLDTGDMFLNMELSHYTDEGQQRANGNFLDIRDSQSPDKMVILSTNKIDHTAYNGGIFGGVFTGISYNIFNSIGVAQSWLADEIENAGWESIIGAFTIPTAIVTKASSLSEGRGYFGCADVPVITNNTRLDGYKPRNKKLYTYPYNYLHIFTNSDSEDFRYEFFDDAEPSFRISWTLVPKPTLTLTPTNYNFDGYSARTITGQEHRLTIDDFPQSAINGDTFKIYLANNMNSIYTKLANAGLGLVSGTVQTIATENLSYLGNSMMSALSLNAGLMDTARKPQTQRGTQVSTADFSLDMCRFTFARMSVKRAVAERIDRFFDLYGYAQKTVMTPYRCARNYWTFVKTTKCNLEGSIPSDDAEALCKLYDNGITFWRYENDREMQIGNYTQLASQNTILQTPIH